MLSATAQLASIGALQASGIIEVSSFVNLAAPATDATALQIEASSFSDVALAGAAQTVSSPSLAKLFSSLFSFRVEKGFAQPSKAGFFHGSASSDGYGRPMRPDVSAGLRQTPRIFSKLTKGAYQPSKTAHPLRFTDPCINKFAPSPFPLPRGER